MSIRRYAVQRFAGLVDGRPSWERIYTPPLFSRDDAKEAMAALREAFPKATFRVRMKPR